jgi:hypothetical protein
MGYNSQATNIGSFVWTDGLDVANRGSQAPSNTFNVHAQNGSHFHGDFTVYDGQLIVSDTNISAQIATNVITRRNPLPMLDDLPMGTNNITNVVHFSVQDIDASGSIRIDDIDVVLESRKINGGTGITVGDQFLSNNPTVNFDVGWGDNRYADGFTNVFDEVIVADNTVTGANLVVNGSFENGLVDWVQTNVTYNPALSNVTVLSGNTGTLIPSNAIAIQADHIYRVSYVYDVNDSFEDITVSLGGYTNTFDTTNTTGAIIGTNVLTMPAVNTDNLKIITVATSNSVTLDDIEVQEITKGRLWAYEARFVNLSIGGTVDMGSNNITNGGTISASEFIGDGSKLTGIVYTETDPLWNGASGNVAFIDATGGWTNLSEYNNDAGFITNYTETDPIWSAESNLYVQASELSVATNPVVVMVRNNADQNISLVGIHKVLYQTEVIDTHSAFATNTFIAPADGKYQLDASLPVGCNLGNTCAIRGYMNVNGTRTDSAIQCIMLEVGEPVQSYATVNVRAILELNQNDSVHIDVQSSGPDFSYTVYGTTGAFPLRATFSINSL